MKNKQATKRKSGAAVRSSELVRLWRGDLVSHRNRGRGVFENYAADPESCFVRFEDSGESDKVTSSMVRKLKEPNDQAQRPGLTAGVERNETKGKSHE